MARRKKRYNPKYRRGELVYRRLVRQSDPLTIADLTDEERLALIFGQSRGVRELLEYADGDLLNLVGRDLRELEFVPNVGPALAAKVAAFFFQVGLICPRLGAVLDGTESGDA